MINFNNIYQKYSTQQMMFLVVIACIPGITIQFYYCGYGIILQILIAIITAFLSELLILIIRKKLVKSILTDHSAIVTAVLFGISLPPFLPFWLNIIGTFFSIVIVKQLYGGLGQNLFNPAMAGYVFLLISSPVFMTTFKVPYDRLLNPPSFRKTINIIFYNYNYSKDIIVESIKKNNNLTQATPLDKFKTDIYLKNRNVKDNISRYWYSSICDFSKINVIWKWINIGYFLGGIFLLWMNIICYRIPLFFLLILTLLSILGCFYDSGKLVSPLTNLFSGATMLGAFFIATDPVTIPTTKKGRIIFGMLIGFLVWLIRSFGGYPDAVAFSILLANITVPLIDYYTVPQVYGYNKE